MYKLFNTTWLKGLRASELIQMVIFGMVQSWRLRTRNFYFCLHGILKIILKLH